MPTDIETLLTSYPPLRGSYSADATDADMLADLKEWSIAAASILAEIIRRPDRMLVDRRRINRGPDMTDEAQPEENPPASTLASTALHTVWHAAAALDTAGVVRTGAPQALPLSGAQEGELDLSDRIRLLAKDRDDRELARASAAAVVTQLRSDIADASALLAAVGVPMDELMIYQGVTELARKLTRALSETDELRAGLMRQRDEALADVSMLERHLDGEAAAAAEIDGYDLWEGWDFDPEGGES